MRKFLNGVMLGLLVGGVVGWFAHGKWTQPAAPEAQQRAETESRRAAEAAGEVAYHLTEAFKAKLEALDLDTGAIKEEIGRTGQVVRRKARELTEPVADAAVDARITAAIKLKLARDRELSARQISVSTAKGRVTLAGAVASPELIGRAVLLAMETDGVREVESNLQVENGD
jgi:hyperosmotically inducible protein